MTSKTSQWDLAGSPVLLIRFDDINESRLQTSPANQEPVNVLLLGQIAAVLLRHAAAIDDARVLGDFGADGFREPRADRGVDLLRLFCTLRIVSAVSTQETFSGF